MLVDEKEEMEEEEQYIQSAEEDVENVEREDDGQHIHGSFTKRMCKKANGNTDTIHPILLDKK